jgi:two-component system phosphate regulon sensor histidine kinase PhoR
MTAYSTTPLEILANLIDTHRDALLATWRRGIRELPSARGLDVPTLNDHIPGLLDELARALQVASDITIPQVHAGGTPVQHGAQRLEDGFEIDEVVAEYNVLRGCIHDLANEHGFNIQGKPFHVINRVLDGAISVAAQTYSTYKALDIQRRREEYLAFVAHDLRTPLNAISLAARVLEMTYADPGKAEATGKMLKTLHRNVQHLSTLVGQVLHENINLQTELGITIECREFDLWPLVESLVHDLHPVGGSGSTRLLNLIPEDLVVYADASLLRRVYQNLIGNAIKFTPRGEITLNAMPTGSDGAVECTVTDNGAGIPAGQLAKIFDKYASDGIDGGLGLGLAIFKSFIEAHNGTVAVESQEGAGTTFRFTLPGRHVVKQG